MNTKHIIRNYSDLIVLTVLWIVSIYSIIVVLLGLYIVGIQNFSGYILLAIITVLRILRIKNFRTVLMIFLIFGTFNAIQFTYSTMGITLTLMPLGNEFHFGFQPLSFILLLFFLLANFSSAMGKLFDVFTQDPRVEIDRQKQIDEHYYKQLKRLPDDELQEIMNNRSDYIYEEVKAARRMLSERLSSEK